MTAALKSGYMSPAWGDGAHIQWYGERGIVNALVNFITQSPDYPEQIRQFLHIIQWADGGTPTWIDRVIDARFIVEMSLADFGNPDLLVVCRTESNQQPYLVFIEAKAKSEVMPPARALLELLAGKVDQTAFFQAHGSLPTHDDPQANDNPFQSALLAGGAIEDAKTDTVSYQDDDRVVIRVLLSDPSVAPFTVPT